MMTDSGPPASRTIGTHQRAGLAVLGLASWGGGALATFTGGSGPGAVALVAAGVVSGALGLIGQWPSRIAVSGNEFVWDEVTGTVEDQIRVADEPAVVEELKDLRARLEQLQRTGSAPEHPAAAYDRKVEAAVRRVRPGARMRRVEPRSREVADYVLMDRRGTVDVETKWRRTPDAPLRPHTIPIPPDRPLIVVTNSRDTSATGELVRAQVGRLQVVSWRDPDDDSALRAALTRALEPSG